MGCKDTFTRFVFVNVRSYSTHRPIKENVAIVLLSPTILQCVFLAVVPELYMVYNYTRIQVNHKTR